MTFDGLWTPYGHQKITLVSLSQGFCGEWIEIEIREPGLIERKSSAQDLDLSDSSLTNVFLCANSTLPQLR